MANTNKTIALIGSADEIEMYLNDILRTVPTATVIPFTTAEEVARKIASTAGLKVVTGIEDDDTRCMVPGAVTAVHCWFYDHGRDLSCMPGDYSADNKGTSVSEIIDAVLAGEPKPFDSVDYANHEWGNEDDFEDEEDTAHVIQKPVQPVDDMDDEEDEDDYDTDADEDDDSEDEDEDDDDCFVPVIVTGGAGDFGYGSPYEFF